MRVTEVIDAYGHGNILSTHEKTLEITRESILTKRGDCVIATRASKGAADLHSEFKKAARREGARITINIEADDVRETVRAFGSRRLSFTHPTDVVVRKSDFVCGRTIAIKADKAAADLSKKLVEKLQNPDQRVRVTLSVETTGFRHPPQPAK